MHLPDGFLSRDVWIGMDVAAVGAVGAAVRRVNDQLDAERVPLMGMTAAFLFAAQMINFPVAGGTSGHLLGGFLAARLLGPAAAVIVMTTVLTVQCLLFQDGGLTALGANVFNIGVLTSVGGILVYRGMRSGSIRWLRRTHERAAVAVAAWSSVMLAAAATALELALSGTAALAVVFPAMLGAHVLIGAGEALLTLGALAVLQRARPEMVPE